MANAKNLTISVDVAQSFVSEIKRIEKALINLKRSVLLSLPVKYGSELWWQKAEEEVDRELSAGNIYKADNVTDLMKQLEE